MKEQSIENNEYPKVLILNQPFVSNTGGGITLSNLFKGWDSEKLAVACSGYIMDPDIDLDICNNYYQLGHKERRWMFPLNLFSRRYPSGKIEFNAASSKKVIPESEKSENRVNFLANIVNPLMEKLGLDQFTAKTHLSEDFKEWMNNYDPDVIYAQCSTRETILFCIAVQEYMRKPMVFHMMDDWITLIGQKSLFGGYWAKKTDKSFRKLLDKCSLHLTISDYMTEEYTSRYGKDFKAFHNPIDLGFWEKGQKTDYSLRSKPTLLYAGRIGLGIDNSLTTIANVVDQINEDHGINLSFVLQCPKAPNWIDRYRHTVFREQIPYGQLPIAFGAADLLILPYDFDPKGQDYIRYSMPTKASEYMASGTPILVFAPLDTALAQYAQSSAWAKLLTNNNEGELKEALMALLAKKEERHKLGKTAIQLAGKRHDDKQVAIDFKKAIVRLVKNQ